MTITAIITAAGKGTRAGFEENKLFQLLPSGETVLYSAVKPFINSPDVTEIIVTSSLEDEQRIKEMFLNSTKEIKVVIGGSTRSDSVQNALTYATGEGVMIHDGARPFLSDKLLSVCVDALKKYGCCAPIIPSVDTIAHTVCDEIVKTQRNDLHRIQTPQCFMTDKIKQAFAMKHEGEIFTDEVGLYCKYISKVHAVKGEEENKKLTYREDFSEMLCGTGFDLHKLTEGRKLILGGIEIPHDKGLLGHSDADVLTHAIMDALLSACSLRDIGYHFSDKDERYKDISSIILLERVLELLRNEGYKPHNVTAVIMAEKPKLLQYIPTITQNLADIMHISPKRIGITATTLEGIGIVGREEGIAVQAYCSVEKI